MWKIFVLCTFYSNWLKRYELCDGIISTNWWPICICFIFLHILASHLGLSKRIFLMDLSLNMCIQISSKQCTNCQYWVKGRIAQCTANLLIINMQYLMSLPVHKAQNIKWRTWWTLLKCDGPIHRAVQLFLLSHTFGIGVELQWKHQGCQRDNTTDGYNK